MYTHLFFFFNEWGNLDCKARAAIAMLHQHDRDARERAARASHAQQPVLQSRVNCSHVKLSVVGSRLITHASWHLRSVMFRVITTQWM